MGNGTYLHQQKPPFKILLKHHRAPGDVVAMTACVGALKRQYGNRYRVSVDTTCMELWNNNPHVEQLTPHECHIIGLEYPLIQRAGQEPVHFMQAFCEDLSRHIKEPVRLDSNRPELFLSEQEKEPFDLPRPYVVVNAGYKLDFTRKFAGSHTFQEIVDHFAGRLTFVQVGEKNPSHIHKPLGRALDWVGKTTTRELIRLAYGSVCGVGPVSLLHHVFAALQKPYVCYIGGAEEVSWEGYNTAVMLNTLGQLPCCATKACWKSRVVPLHDGQDKALCELPVVTSCGENIPKCMQLLGSEPAIKALETMLNNGRFG